MGRENRCKGAGLVFIRGGIWWERSGKLNGKRNGVLGRGPVAAGMEWQFSGRWLAKSRREKYSRKGESGKVSSLTSRRGVRYNAKVNGRRLPTDCKGDAVMPRNHTRSGSISESTLGQLLALWIRASWQPRPLFSSSVQKRNVNVCNTHIWALEQKLRSQVLIQVLYVYTYIYT